MANTEGIPDEHLASLFSIPPSISHSSSQPNSAKMKRKERLAKRDKALRAQQQGQGIQDQDPHSLEKKSPESVMLSNKEPVSTNVPPKSKSRFRMRREEMMELADGMTPSAKVIRSTTSSKKSSFRKSTPVVVAPPTESQFMNVQDQEISENQSEENQNLSQSATGLDLDSRSRPIIMSDAIRERPVRDIHIDNGSTFKPGQKLSRFKQRINTTTKGGFPSLDLPIGTFIRKKDTPLSVSRSNSIAPSSAQTLPLPVNVDTVSNKDKIDKSEADAILDSMSPEQIRYGVRELESALSPDLIAFLRTRGQNKNDQKKSSISQQVQLQQPKSVMKSNNIESMTKKQNDQIILEEKERTAKILSSIQTVEDLDKAFASMQSGIEDPTVSASNVTMDSNNQTTSEILTATSLLRSSSSHQRLLAVKTLSSLLEKGLDQRLHYEKQQKMADTIPLSSNHNYPPILPVSLRCLLDLPSPHKHILLHRHVLQSIYSLLLLFSCPEHRVILPIFSSPKHSHRYNEDHSFLYQKYFLEDNIPTTPPGSVYKSSPSSTTSTSDQVEAGCYATDSSAQTATLDGSAFYTDPMWTLLSRMRILPCLSNLLHYCQGRLKRDQRIETCDEKMDESSNLRALTTLPDESWISICGILTMICTRSPGAACAIAQHKTILKEVIEGTLMMPTGDEDDHENSGFVVRTKVALPALILLCTLARQSRVVASCEQPFANVITVLQAILGMEAENDEERMVQFYALTLWRILLRYGLAIPHLSTFLSISTPYLSSAATVSQSSQNLASEYLTCFANVCDCAKVVTRSPTEFQASSQIGKQVKLTRKQRETLASAGGWLGSHARQCASLLHDGINCDAFITSNIKIVSARLRFLASFITAVAPTPLSHMGIEEDEEEAVIEMKRSEELRDVLSKGAFHSILPMKSCLESLQYLFEDKNGIKMLDSALDIVLCNSFALNWEDINDSKDPEALEKEASCASLLKGCSLLLWSMSTAQFLHQYEKEEELLNEVSRTMLKFGEIVFQAVMRQFSFSSRNGDACDACDALNTETDMTKIKTDVINQFSIARIGWLNSAQSFLSKFLGLFLRHQNQNENENENDLDSKKANPSENENLPHGFQIARVFMFCLLGRLQPGEESLAAMILSEDIRSPYPSYSYRYPYRNRMDEGDTGDTYDENIFFPSPIQKFLIRELCSSKHSRNQLLHSAKVCKSIGFIADARGPFALESLRSDVDRIDNPHPVDSEKEDNSRPLSDLGFTLPLGEHWLWHVLSSTIDPVDFDLSKEKQSKQSSLESKSNEPVSSREVQILNEAINIVSSCLRLLTEMENEDKAISGLFVSRVDTGFKLYHLTNVCLFPEEILRDDTVNELFISLFQKLATLDDTNANANANALRSATINTFVSACFEHSKITRVQNDSDSTQKSKEQQQSEEKLLFGDSAKSQRQQPNSFSFSNPQIQSIQDYMNDVMNVFLEFGAQYKAFVYCVRFLLRPNFPSSAISNTLLKLKDTIHLLTIEEEESDIESTRKFLEYGLSGGLPSKDHSRRDLPEVLDAYATLLKKKTVTKESSLRKEYIYMIAIGYLSRNLASSLQRCECGVEAFKKRLSNLDATILRDVFTATKRFLESEEGSKSDLINIVCELCLSDDDMDVELGEMLESLEGDIKSGNNWQKVTDLLKN